MRSIFQWERSSCCCRQRQQQLFQVIERRWHSPTWFVASIAEVLYPVLHSTTGGKESFPFYVVQAWEGGKFSSEMSADLPGLSYCILSGKREIRGVWLNVGNRSGWGKKRWSEMKSDSCLLFLWPWYRKAIRCAICHRVINSSVSTSSSLCFSHRLFIQNTWGALAPDLPFRLGSQLGRKNSCSSEFSLPCSVYKWKNVFHHAQTQSEIAAIICWIKNFSFCPYQREVLTNNACLTLFYIHFSLTTDNRRFGQ